MFIYNRKPIEKIIMSKEEIIYTLNNNGYTTIHLIGDLYLVRKYSKYNIEHEFSSTYTFELIR